MLNEVLERALRTVKHGALVCIVSDFFGADDTTRKRITRLAEHNDVIAGLLYDPVKVDLPAASRLIVSDGDLQLELDARSGGTRKTLSDYFTDDLRKRRA